MLIITGTGRSGTSVIAAFCNKMGYGNPGQDTIDPTIRGGCETAGLGPLIFEDIKKKISDDVPLDPNHYKPIIEKVTGGLPVIKSPRFINWDVPQVWGLWKKAIAPEELRVLICYRDFNDTAKSFQKYQMSEFAGREIYTDRETKLLAERLERKFQKCLLTLVKEDIPFAVINFPGYLFDYNRTRNLLQSFAGFTIDYDLGKEKWDQLIETQGYEETPAVSLSLEPERNLESRQHMHNHMAIDLDEAVELTHINEKIIPIIPTSMAPIECLLWSVFSLLLRARPDDLIEHFCVCINGPDKRTGDHKIGDLKQQFLEELRSLKWYHADRPKVSKDMPITVIRAWSRIGHPEAVEMAIPWVHTDAYLLMHDDIIITKHDWLDEVRKKFYGNPNVAIAYAPTLMCCQTDSAIYNNKNLLRFPHLLCCFLVCRKKYTRKIGGNWCGYHIPTPPFRLEELVGDVGQFMEYYKKQRLLDNPPQTKDTYDYISMEMGAWHFYNCVQAGYEFAGLDPTLLVHLGTMSWESETGKQNRVHRYQQHINDLEAEIAEHPEYSKLYNKYIRHSSYHKVKHEKS